MLSPRTFDLSTNTAIQPNPSRMVGFIVYEMKVGDCELDQYGVVNNAVYSDYCYCAHHEWLNSIDVSLDAITCDGESLALSETSLKFLSSLRSGGRFVLKMRFLDISKARIYIEHKIFKLPNMEAILEAQVTRVWLNKNHRPMQIPQKYLSKFAQFIHDHNQSNRSTVGIKDDNKDGAKFAQVMNRRVAYYV
ncbi:acyl-acyl carrier protein thioesterase ATL4, chloroplastic-like [Cucurbita maxima]|uniref:Acyl-acyl carrier protein thioesterase ATL4, chloroplastic-like n=1 Tax=Cucurbita maxima TaxID=3661 RepID=A0A6J1HTM2_CUCMA|nr:acyl-acyl carrier protein thioesterase ATL4, chloroplastic-like [Cucurbita maxima]